MVRLIHTADWHLGHSLHGFDRDAEHAAFLDHLINLAAERRVHGLIVAGDVFHQANPPLESVRRFFSFIESLRRRAPHAHLVVIAGNHDSGARLELPLALGPDPRLAIMGAPGRRDRRPDPAANLAPIHDETGAVAAVVLGLPYPRPGDLADFSEPNPPREGAATDRPVRSFLRRGADAAAARWPGAPLIVTAHLHVAGGVASAESERRIVIGGEEAAPISDFPAEAAYVALGHLHRPQTLSGAPLARYAGAPIPLSLDERAHKQSVTIVTLPEGAAPAQVEVAPLPRSRAFLRTPERGALTPEAAEAELEALAARLASDPTSVAAPPFLEVAVSLAGPEPDLRRRLEQALGDAPVRLARLRRAAPEAEGGAAANEPEDERPPSSPSPLEAFEALHQARFAAPPDAALRAAFETLLKAVENEDDAVSADREGAAKAGEGPAGRPGRALSA